MAEVKVKLLLATLYKIPTSTKLPFGVLRSALLNVLFKLLPTVTVLLVMVSPVLPERLALAAGTTAIALPTMAPGA